MAENEYVIVNKADFEKLVMLCGRAMERQISILLVN